MAVFGNEMDITLFFNYIIPPGVKGKTVAFVHDMAYKAFPETIRKETKVSWMLHWREHVKMQTELLQFRNLVKAK